MKGIVECKKHLPPILVPPQVLAVGRAEGYGSRKTTFQMVN